MLQTDCFWRVRLTQVVLSHLAAWQAAVQAHHAIHSKVGVCRSTAGRQAAAVSSKSGVAVADSLPKPNRMLRLKSHCGTTEQVSQVL